MRHVILPVRAGGHRNAWGSRPASPTGDAVCDEEGFRAGRVLLPILVVVATLASCDFLDPTSVENPNVTDEDFLKTPNAATTWARGVERQLAAAVDQLIMGAEVVSDNVFNNRTLFSKVFDNPLIEPTDFDVTNIQEAIHRLREMATYGLEVVVEADQAATDETRALLHFRRGYAFLLAGENFVGLPAEAGGPVVEPEGLLTRAINDFEQARNLSSDSDMKSAATLAIARAHYAMGNKAEAVAAAAIIRSTAPMLLRQVQYDVTDGPTNTMQFAVYDSGQDEFQPLPRLDFLFPKYYSESAGDQSPIALLKGEEAFLILAEASIADGDLAGARAHLLELLDVVAARPKALIDDRGQSRGRQGGTWIYPNSSAVRVAASPDDPPRAGLVLTRSEGRVEVPIVSGTSVTPEMLNAATDEESLLELLYLMRQEIFVLEGRRMSDLGIRFPVAMREAETNPNVGRNSPYLQARIPPFIPLNREMDAFAYKDGDTIAVIRHNMNRVLVQNRTSPAVLPFH